MADSTKVRMVKDLMDMMTTHEHLEIEQTVLLRRKARGFRFMDLAAEIRNRVYRLAITPDTIKTHVTTGKAPSLLMVSKQVNHEVKGLYYSTEYMHARLYDSDTSTWRDVTEEKVFRALVARWIGCFFNKFPEPMNDIKRWAITKDSILVGKWAGTFAWQGIKGGQAYRCTYDSNSERHERANLDGKLVKRRLLPNGEFQSKGDRRRRRQQKQRKRELKRAAKKWDAATK